MQISTPITVKIGEVLTSTGIVALVHGVGDALPEEGRAAELGRVAAAAVVEDAGVARELVDPDHVVGAVAVDVGPAQVGAVHAVGEFHLAHALPAVVAVVHKGARAAVLLYAQVVAAAVAGDVAEAHRQVVEAQAAGLGTRQSRGRVGAVVPRPG